MSATMREIERAYESGIIDERARIVAWLRWAAERVEQQDTHPEGRFPWETVSDRKPSTSRAMTPRCYPILVRAVEEGVEAGWRRAHKHAAAPSEASVCEEIVGAVLSMVNAVFDFFEDVP